MPPLVRRYLKTAIGFLIFGVGLGLYMLARRELAGIWSTPWWISAHTHAILVGFVMMMILGVALWMFPRPARDDTHFDPRFAAGPGRADATRERGAAAPVDGGAWRGRPGCGLDVLLLDDVDPHPRTARGRERIRPR